MPGIGDGELSRTAGAWPDRRLLDLLGIELPILLAPMAGVVGAPMAIAVAAAGGLGALPCALLSPDQMRQELDAIRRSTSRPINMNFFCHKAASFDPDCETAWRRQLIPYYTELGLDPGTAIPASNIVPFDAASCDLLVELEPAVVSFHFGLPAKDLLDRVKATGAKILSSATTVDEARWLEDNGCDAIIAQGFEAGGHRGMFLSRDIATQAGTMALVPQVVDAVKLPVIAAGGIGDSRGIAAAFALGASALQMGTAFLLCPAARTATLHRQALRTARDNQTVITNVFSGRPARAIVNRATRELGPLAEAPPAFPLAGNALAPLRAKAESLESDDFTPLWAGQAAGLSRGLPAGRLTRLLAEETLAKLVR
ncbi:MAG: NAD(P)H-dependent flavin oxidoreductase [Dongiales bacterium]